MKRLLLILFGVLIYNIMSAQVTITTDTTSDKFKIQESTYITDMPLGSVYVDVNSSGNIGLKILGTDKLIVGYKTPATYTINGVLQSNKDTCVKYLSLATSLKLEYLISNISSGGGGSSYSAKNGIYIDSDTIKLGGNITEDTKLDNPNSKSIQIGSDGDAMNLNVVPPSPYRGLISTYSGYDYRSAEYMSFIGVLKGLNFAPFGFVNQDMVGTFTIVGNPFDSIFPDGSVMIDGVWEEEGEVIMNKVYLTFSGSDLIFNLVSQFKNEQGTLIEGDNANQSQSIQGYSATQNQNIIGDNASQSQSIQGYSASQNQYINGDSASQNQNIDGNNGNQTKYIQGDYGEQKNGITGDDAGQTFDIVGDNGIQIHSIIGNNATQNQNIEGDNANQNQRIEGNTAIQEQIIVGDSAIQNQGIQGDNAVQYQRITGVNAKLQRLINNNTDSKYFTETITDTKQRIEVDSVEFSVLNIGFFGTPAIPQPILPLGSSTDDVIQVLQNLGLVREN